MATFTRANVTGNSAIINGGIDNINGTVTLTNVTVVLNRANSDGIGAETGGGIAIPFSDPTTLLNSIVAGNLVRAAAGVANDIGGGAVRAASAFNLIGDPVSAGGQGNILGNGSRAILPLASILDPALRNNGGTTPTHALVPGSPTIDTGSNALLVTPTAVTTSTTNDFFPVGQIIDGSGLSAAPTLANLASVTHADGNSNTVSWVTEEHLPDYFASRGPVGLIFTLPSLTSLTDLVLWGHTFDSVTNNDVKSLRVAFSADGGTTFGTPITLEHQRTGTAGEVLSFGRAYAANKVKLTITDNHFGTPGTAGGDRVGLGEVRFITASTDQRGPGFPRLAGAGVDIGAYELPRPLFDDTFERPANSNLGAPWVTRLGSPGVTGTAARGTGTAPLHVATLDGQTADDADVNLGASALRVTNKGHRPGRTTPRRRKKS